MALNIAQGNMYSFVTHTWCPLGGQCPHKCSYCYVSSSRAKSKYTGEVRMYEKTLNIDLGTGKFIFVCHMIDLFAEGIPHPLIYRVLEKCKQHPGNKYLLQSKNPKQMIMFEKEFPPNVVVGTTIESDLQWAEMGEAPPPLTRAVYLNAMSARHTTMLTIEPIMDFGLIEMIELVKMCRGKSAGFWCNIGADSKKHNVAEPHGEKIKALIEMLKLEGINVIPKDNLKRLLK